MPHRPRPRASSRRSASSWRRPWGPSAPVERAPPQPASTSASSAAARERAPPAGAARRRGSCQSERGREQAATEHRDRRARRRVQLDREPQPGDPLGRGERDGRELPDGQALRPQPHGRRGHDEQRGREQRADGRERGDDRERDEHEQQRVGQPERRPIARAEPASKPRASQRGPSTSVAATAAPRWPRRRARGRACRSAAGSRTAASRRCRPSGRRRSRARRRPPAPPPARAPSGCRSPRAARRARRSTPKANTSAAANAPSGAEKPSPSASTRPGKGRRADRVRIEREPAHHDPRAEQARRPREQQHLEHAALHELELEGVEHGAESNRYSFPLQATAQHGVWPATCGPDPKRADLAPRRADLAPALQRRAWDVKLVRRGEGRAPSAGRAEPTLARPRTHGAGTFFPARTCGRRARWRGGRMTTPLPAAPSLEQLRKQAKELVRERRGRGRAAAPERGATRARARVRLPELASPQGLRRARRRPTALGSRTPSSTSIGYYEDRAEGLRSVVDERPRQRHRDRARLPPRARRGASDAEIRALSPADARLVLAREHGFASWAAFRRHVDGLAESGEPFRRAFRAIQARDGQALGALLDRYPGLVTARGTNGNDLLGLARRRAGATTRRSCASCSRAAPTRTAPTTAAGRRCTRRATATTSSSPALLLDAGARTDLEAHGEGGTPLAAALFWGHTRGRRLPRGARHRAAQPAHRGRPRPARPDPRASCGDDGSLREEAGAARGFYRPHSGLPDLAALRRPAGDPRRGARVGRQERPRRTCSARSSSSAPTSTATPTAARALTWAAANGRVASIAPPARARRRLDRLGTFGGPDHGQGVTALHLAAQSGQRQGRGGAARRRRRSDDRRMPSTAGGPRAGPTSAGTRRSRSCSTPAEGAAP